MIDIEATAEARAIAIYEAVHDNVSSRTPWTHLPPGEWEKWRRAANVAQQVAVPHGWQLVPITITENMHRAAVCMLTHCNGNDDFPPRVYKAMLAEAPPSAAYVPLTDAEIVKIMKTCHDGICYPQDMICGPRAMRITEGRAIEQAVRGKT